MTRHTVRKGTLGRRVVVHLENGFDLDGTGDILVKRRLLRRATTPRPPSPRETTSPKA